MPAVLTKLKTTAVCGALLTLLAQLPVRGKMATMLGAEWLKALVVARRGCEVSIDLLWFYGISFIATALSCIVPECSARVKLMAAMQLVWATRLGTFLATRPAGGSQTGNSYAGVTKKVQRDQWLDFNYTLIAGLWRVCTCIPLWLRAAKKQPHDLSEQQQAEVKVQLPWQCIAGAACWLVGLATEAVADLQKIKWAHEHPGQFVNTGLWTVVRHPNYLGEILVWVGHFIVGAPYGGLPEWLAASSSPLVTFLRLRYVSGIPLVDKAACVKWGNDPAFITYVERTPLLWPKLV